MNLMNKKVFAWIMQVCLSAMMTSLCALAPVGYAGYEQEYRYNQERTVPSPCRPRGKRCTKEERLRGFCWSEENQCASYIISNTFKYCGVVQGGKYGHGVLKLGCRV